MTRISMWSLKAPGVLVYRMVKCIASRGKEQINPTGNSGKKQRVYCLPCPVNMPILPRDFLIVDDNHWSVSQ